MTWKTVREVAAGHLFMIIVSLGNDQRRLGKEPSSAVHRAFGGNGKSGNLEQVVDQVHVGNKDMLVVQGMVVVEIRPKKPR